MSLRHFISTRRKNLYTQTVQARSQDVHNRYIYTNENILIKYVYLSVYKAFSYDIWNEAAEWNINILLQEMMSFNLEIIKENTLVQVGGRRLY